MNKPLFVVEGKDDIAKLKSLGCTYVVETTGTLVPYRFVQFLKTVQEKRAIILVLDPDGPGEKIRKRLHEALKAPLDVSVPKEKAIRHQKVGIHETEAGTLREALAPYLQLETYADEIPSFTMKDLVELGLNGEGSYQKKYSLCGKLNLTFRTNRTLVQDLCILCLDKNAVEEYLK